MIQWHANHESLACECVFIAVVHIQSIDSLYRPPYRTSCALRDQGST
jgi:hypothetical protein